MNLIDLLKKHEGFRPKPYRDTEGILTIGFGRNIENSGITIEEAEILLMNDIALVQSQAIENFPWFHDLGQARRDAVLSMIFNLGLHSFLGFKKTISAIASGEFEIASKEMMDSKWATQVGSRAYELSEMMRTNEYFGEGNKS
jgi:lysozyme